MVNKTTRNPSLKAMSMVCLLVFTPFYGVKTNQKTSRKEKNVSQTAPLHRPRVLFVAFGPHHCAGARRCGGPHIEHALPFWGSTVAQLEDKEAVFVSKLGRFLLLSVCFTK